MTQATSPGAMVRPTSDALPTLPTSGRTVTLCGLIVLLIAFGGFGAWAGLANLSVSVVATGTVSVDSFKKVVQHLEGGIVSDIRVDDGDHVEQGQTLMVLDSTQVRSRLDIARSNWFIARAQEARLLAEQEGRDRLIYPSELTELAADTPRLERILSVQRSLFLSRRQSLASEIGALNEQMQQFSEQSEGLKRAIAINERRSDSLEGEASDYRSLFREGLGNNQRVRELTRQQLQLDADSAQSRARIAQLTSQVSENRARIEAKRQEYQKDIGEQLREAQSQLADAREKMVALTDQVRRTTLSAPVSGTVVGLETHTLGAVIQPGTPIMSIVPATDGFFVEARIPAQDIDNVFPGQHANIRFSAFNQHRAPVIDGEVEHVSADSFQDENTGARYYKARVKITDAGREDMTEHMNLLSGMPAEVMIQTGEKTLFAYLAQPIVDMFHRALRQD